MMKTWVPDQSGHWVPQKKCLCGPASDTEGWRWARREGCEERPKGWWGRPKSLFTDILIMVFKRVFLMPKCMFWFPSKCAASNFLSARFLQEAILSQEDKASHVRPKVTLHARGKCGSLGFPNHKPCSSSFRIQFLNPDSSTPQRQVALTFQLNWYAVLLHIKCRSQGKHMV